jgi:hypothetical protein
MSVITKNAEIDSAELAQRVAVLRRFKTLLTQQRDRFRSYLNILDKQQNVIESGSPEDLLNYVELEEKIVADIFSIQKVIDPLEEMYNTVVSNYTPANANSEDDEVPSIKASLENLKSEAIIRSTKNKEILSKRMLELREEIKNLRNNPYAANKRRSSFGNLNTASVVDISG